MGRAKETAISAKEKAREIGSGAVNFVRRNPFPVLLAGAGIGWLIVKGRKGAGLAARQKTPYPNERRRLGRKAYAAEKAAEYGERARETAISLYRVVESRPLATGLAAAAAGFLAGLLIKTRKQKRMTGKYGPEAAPGARERAGEVTEEEVEAAVKTSRSKESYNKPF